MRDYREFLGEILIPEDKLQVRIAELGAQISRDYAGKDGLLLVCILRGGGIVFDRPHAKNFHSTCNRVYGCIFIWFRWS